MTEPHDPRLYHCPDCGDELIVYRKSRLHSTFEWCRRCHQAVLCSCEICETFRALEAL